LFGLTFLNSLFLAGLAAAALPILIHLFSKKKAQDVPFSSIEYLREISIKKVRRMRLRQFLLLALRVLIIALFALAMTRPAIRGSQSPLTHGSSTVALVLDTSYSMGAYDPALASDLTIGTPGTDQMGTLFDSAKQRALEIIDLMSEGDTGVLAFSGQPITLPFQTPVANLGLLRQEVERAPLVDRGSDLRVAAEQAIEILRSSRTINKELYIVSDFQNVDLTRWSESRDGGRLATLLGGSAGDSLRTGSLPEDLRVYLVPVREEQQQNLSIAEIRLDSSGGAAGAGRVITTIRNHGNDPVPDRLARLMTADDAETPLADVRFAVPALGEAEIEMDLPGPLESGVLKVELGADMLERDNQAYLVTSDPGTRQVLLIRGSQTGRTVAARIGGSEATGLVQDDGLYIQRALDPAGDGRFHKVVVMGPEGLSDPTNLGVDVVVLSDVGRLSPTAVQNLARFRSRGGGIFICLGDRVDMRYYNAQVLNSLAPAIEMMNVLAEPGEGTYRTLRPAAVGHPIFNNFPIAAGDDLSSARFNRIVDSKAGEGARVVAHFGNQVPALIEQDGVVLFTSSLDGVWNDFVTSAAFLPTIHQVIRYLGSRSVGDKGPRSVGDPLESVLEQDAYQAPVAMVDPREERSFLEAVPLEGMERFRLESTTSAGIYRLVDGSQTVLAQFAVNLDAREGDLSVAPDELIHRTFGRSAQILDVSQPITRDLLEGRYGRELWRLLLMIVLGLLVVESFLGRGKFLG